MSDEKTSSQKKGWGIHLTVPGGELTDEQAAKIHESVHKLIPQLVETIAKAHGIDAHSSSLDVHRTP
jgi:hypothetical protein